MSHYSNISTALSEKQHGRGREALHPGSFGVCLDDDGLPVRLYIVDTVYGCGSIDAFSIDNDFDEGGNLRDDAKPRRLHMRDFWALT